MNFDHKNIKIVKNKNLKFDFNRLKKKFGEKFLKSNKIIVLRNIDKHWIVYGIMAYKYRSRLNLINPIN